MNFFTLVWASTAITNFLMTFITLYAGRRTINIIWAFFCLSVAVLGYWLMMVSITEIPENALFWWRASYLWVTNIPILILHTTFLILWGLDLRRKWVLFIGYFLTLIFHTFNVSWLLIQEVTFMYNEIYIDTPYSAYFFCFSLFFNAIFVFIFYLLFRAYKKSREEEKKRVLYFSTGIAVGVFGWGALFLPVYWINIYPYTAILTWLYPVIIGYSILHHHLFDARSAILQILRIVFIIVISAFSGMILWYISVNYFQYTPKIQPVETLLWISLLIVAFLLNRSRKISGFFLLASLAELKRETEKFLDKKWVYRSAVELLSDLEGIFWNAMKIRKVEILGSDQTVRYPKCQEYFKNYRRPLVLSELKTEDVEGETRDLLVEVEKIWDVIFSIDHGKKEWDHFLVLGQKESEHTITQEEIKIIHRIIPKIALSLQVLDFNSSLQEEVRIQTKTLNSKNKELEIAYRKLQDVDQNKDNFLAIASHELRTPMTIIKGYSDLFLNNAFWSLSPEARSYMQKIFNNTESLIELVNNILDISKIEAGRFEILWEEVNIKDIIEKCVENFENLYREKGIALILTDSSKIDTITTDQSKFILVCNNLLSNAYKFTEAGGRVEIKVFIEAECLFVKITDTGKGIESEKIDHIFEKFNQMDNTNYTKKSIHGTGLWLHLCRQIIQLLGGWIRVESKVGVGSSFIFFIPLHHDNQSAM